MQSVGIRLREAREKKGYSLDDINSRTRINSKNLASIERDEVHDLSSPFFYRSFVRQYAETVGLDFQILSAGVEALAGHMRQPDLPGQGEHQIVRVAPLQARPKRDWSWVVPAMFLLGVVSVGSAGYAYVKFFDPSVLHNSVISALLSRTTAAKTAQVAASAQAPPANALSGKALPNPNPQPPKSQAKIVNGATSTTPAQLTANRAASSESSPPLTQPVPPVLVTDKIRLELAATERTWLSVSADGKPAYTGILEPLETKILEGQDNARLRTGNAGGVSIIFNGKPIGAIGPRGTTRTVIFSKTGYEIEPTGGARLTPVNHIGG